VNLEGSLDAFGLPDVFSLLAMTGKSGRLRLRRTGSATPVEGVVWFHDGRVTGANADCSRQGLVRRIIGSGAVDDVALTTAVGRAGTSPVGVARALLEAGAVEPELLREAAVDQVVDAVFDLSRWENGDFGFDPGARNQDDVGIALDHSWLVAEAKARTEAWEEIRAVVPAPESIPTMPVVLPEDPNVTRDEWALLALVDGRRTVQDLVELTGCGLFAVASVLAGLVRRSLLAVHEPGVEDHVGVVERRVSLLVSLEGQAPAAIVPAAPEPQPEPQAQVENPVEQPADVPAAPAPAPDQAPSRLSASDALAAARLVQGLGGTLPPRPAARREVVPPRPEPFLPTRQPEHPEVAPAAMSPATGPSQPMGRTAFTGGPSAPVAPAPPSPVGPPSTTSPTTGTARTLTATAGNTAMAAAPLPMDSPSDGGGVDGVASRVVTGEQGIIERDPSVNRSLLLRLIAGVRGL
jgi:hypothetical protein